jgi:hypothetical protein
VSARPADRGAFVLAVPLTWYVMNGWLQDFEYRITLGPGTSSSLVATEAPCW